MNKLLLIEDDETLAREIIKLLENEDFECKLSLGDNIAELIQDFKPHIVLMDIMLPHKNGFYYCSEIRRISKIPIIFLSSAYSEMNVKMALDFGADDFIEKPFSKQILLAKINSLLRRSYEYQLDNSTLEYEGVVLDILKSIINYKEESIKLSKTECLIMQLLMAARGNIVKREKILDLLWENSSFIDENTLSVNIVRIRKKLSDINLDGFIKTQKGEGYYV